MKEEREPKENEPKKIASSLDGIFRAVTFELKVSATFNQPKISRRLWKSALCRIFCAHFELNDLKSWFCWIGYSLFFLLLSFTFVTETSIHGGIFVVTLFTTLDFNKLNYLNESNFKCELSYFESVKCKIDTKLKIPIKAILVWHRQQHQQQQKKATETYTKNWNKNTDQKCTHWFCWHRFARESFYFLCRQAFRLTHFYCSKSMISQGIFGVIRVDLKKLNAEIYISFEWMPYVHFSRPVFHLTMLSVATFGMKKIPLLPWEMSFKCILHRSVSMRQLNKTVITLLDFLNSMWAVWVTWLSCNQHKWHITLIRIEYKIKSIDTSVLKSPEKRE